LRGRDAEAELGTIVEYAPQGGSQASVSELLVDAGLCGRLPAGPERTVPTFATGQDGLKPVVLQGSPLYCDGVLRLCLGDSIHEATMTLHVNGFTVSERGPAAPGPLPSSLTRLWSPFSLVEKCQVRAKQQDTQWAIFKLTFFRKEGQDASFYFATSGPDAEGRRERWVEQISGAVGNLTLSLFPRFELSVDPVPGRAGTSTRIMAGYLLQGGAADRASLVFCELHAYVGREARLVLYRDEWCEQEVLSIAIRDSSVVSTRKGAYCTVFGVNDQLFCARTEDERELWLRAISNIKVKLMFDAPDPSPEELEVFRCAVSERIGTLPPPLPPGGRVAAEAFAVAAGRHAPVLAEVPRRPPAGPHGDDSSDPEHPAPEDPVDAVAPVPECGFAPIAASLGPARSAEVPPESRCTSACGVGELSQQEAVFGMQQLPKPRKLGGLVAMPVTCSAIVSIDATAGACVEGL